MKAIRFILLTFCMTGFATMATAHDIPDAETPEAQAYARICSACHTLAHPKRLDWHGWQHMLGVMQKRMSERGMPAPEPEEWAQLETYLRRHAR